MFNYHVLLIETKKYSEQLSHEPWMKIIFHLYS